MNGGQIECGECGHVGGVLCDYYDTFVTIIGHADMCLFIFGS